MRNILIFLFTAVLFLPLYALAICPVCSVAVAGGVGFSRWLGIDDTISGIWIGGLIISLVIWFLSWLDKKNIKFNFRELLIFILFYLIVVFPLHWMGLINQYCDQLWGFNKLLVGILFGSLVFAFSILLHNLLKKKHNNKVYFSFQKVVIPVIFLIIVSIIFYFITKC